MRIGFLSRTKGRLDIGDLPHLPYSNRAENMRLTAQGTLFVPYALDPCAHTNALVTGDAAPESNELTAGRKAIGSWELAKYLYQGKARIILNCKHNYCWYTGNDAHHLIPQSRSPAIRMGQGDRWVYGAILSSRDCPIRRRRAIPYG